MLSSRCRRRSYTGETKCLRRRAGLLAGSWSSHQRVDVVNNDGLASHRLAALPLRPIPKAVGAAGVAALGVYAGQATKYRRNDRRILDCPEPAAAGSLAFFPVAPKERATPPSGSERVWAMHIGSQIAPAMVNAIAGARVSVDLSNYISCACPSWSPTWSERE